VAIDPQSSFGQEDYPALKFLPGRLKGGVERVLDHAAYVDLMIWAT
jgi:hypothetical protein